MTTVCVYLEHITQEDLDAILDGYECIRSPLHDKDVFEEGPHKGELKKAHWHVVFQYALKPSQKKYFNRLVGLSDNFLHQEVMSGEGILKYLTHEDKPNKYHYNQEDIRATEFFDWDYALTYVKKPKQKSYLKELCDIVISNEIYEYADFAELLLQNENEELTEYAFRHESKIKHLIDSRRYRAMAKHEDKLADALMKERELNGQMLELLKYITENSKTDQDIVNDLIKKMYEKML